jgi:predicted membrane protein
MSLPSLSTAILSLFLFLLIFFSLKKKILDIFMSIFSKVICIMHKMTHSSVQCDCFTKVVFQYFISSTFINQNHAGRNCESFYTIVSETDQNEPSQMYNALKEKLFHILHK